MAGVNLGSAYGRITVVADGVRAGINVAKQAFEEGGRAADAFGQRLGQGVRSGSNIVSAEAGRIGEGIKSALPDSIGMSIGLGIGGAIAGGMAAAAGLVTSSIDKFREQGVALSKLSSATGMAAQDLSALSIIARENEVSFDTLRTSMTRFSRVVADTKGPTANVKEELMLLADQFKNMADGPQKTELALASFGRSGAELIPILNMGREGLVAYAAELERTGTVMDERAVAAANRYDEAMDRLERSNDRVTVSIGSRLVPVMASWSEAVDILLGGEADLVAKGYIIVGLLNGSANAAAIYAARTRDAGSASLGTASAMTTMSKAAMAAQAALAAAQKASADWAAANGNLASAGKVIGGDADKQFDREQRRMQVTRDANAVLREQARLMQNADRETARLGDSYGTLTAEEQATAKWADEVNERFDGTAKSAGGAAKATEELAEAQDLLQKRTQGIGSAMGSNLGPMSDTEKFQKAWAVATGETTLAEIEQEAAVKSVMKALEEKRISQQEALATLLALRGGLIDTKQAMAEAGDPSKQFADEVEAVRAMTEGAIEKVRGLSLGINTLPTGKVVGLNINVTGQQALLDAHERMAAMRDRDVRLSVNVAGMPELNKVYEILVAARGGTPLPGGAPAPGAPPSLAPADSADTGVTKGGGSDVHDRHGTQGAKTIVFQVGDDVVAKATVNGKGAVGVARKNAARSWRN